MMRLRCRASGWSRRRSSVGIDQRKMYRLTQCRVGLQTLWPFQCCRLENPHRHAMLIEESRCPYQRVDPRDNNLSLKSGDSASNCCGSCAILDSDPRLDVSLKIKDRA